MKSIDENKKRLIVKSYWNAKLSDSVAVVSGRKSDQKVLCKSIPAADLGTFNQITAHSTLSEYTALVALYHFLLEVYFSDIFDGLVFSDKNIAPLANPFILKLSKTTKEQSTKAWLKEVAGELKEVSSYLQFEEKGLDSYSNFGFSYSGNSIENERFKKLFLKITKTDKGDLDLSFHYDSQYLKASLIESFANSFLNLITELKEILNTSLKDITYLSVAEIEQVIQGFNNNNRPFAERESIVDLFESQVIQNPDHTALCVEDKTWSYAILNKKANALAHYLTTNYNIQANDRIAIKLERDEQLIIAILGVLKTGAAYVPIDLAYPEERIQYIETDSNCQVLIDQDLLNDFYETKDQYAQDNPEKTHQAEDLAYLIYTSGSTGNPKGVMIKHGNASQLMDWAKVEYQDSDFETTYAATSHCFDLSVYEIFFTLSQGKTIRLLRNPLEIGTFLSKDTKVLINTVPSVIRKLIEAGSYDPNRVNVLNLAGEAFPTDIVPQLSVDQVEVRNLYGPSEDTTYSTCYRLSNKVYRDIPIGKPIANTQAYVLDDNLRPVPVGVTGRLFVAGMGVAKGYLNQPDLTAEKFIANPFIQGGRMYDTGDLAKWQENGDLTFQGRKDYQVKLNGYRIELGEIEHAILDYSNDFMQVVVDVKEVEHKKVLIGYFTLSQAINKATLRSYLETVLPAYMVPNYFIEMDEFPLTPNGKVNRKALPKELEEHIVKKTYLAPRNKTEAMVAEVWEEVLGVHEIGVHDQFFHLGGHSLMIAQVINRLYKKLGKSISYRFFYNNPSVASLAAVLEDNAFSSITKTTVADSYPLTAAQHRLWMLSQLDGGNEAYKIAGAIKLRGAIDKSLFAKAFQNVVKQHESLRTIFKENESGDLAQYIVEVDELNDYWSTCDFSSEDAPDEAVSKWLETAQAQTFELSETPLFRVALLKTGTNEQLFYLELHHIISDGWSLEVLTKAVLQNYESLQTGEALSVTEDAIQYKDYTQWLAEQTQTAAYQEAKEFWLEEFKTPVPTLHIPGYQARPTVKTYHGKTIDQVFSTEQLNRLKLFSKKQGVTLFTTLNTVVNILLARYSRQEEIVVGTAVAGRNHPDLENQLGLYVNTLAIRTTVNPKDSFEKLLAQTSAKLLQAFEYQNYPFDQLVEQLNLRRDAARSPLFDVMVTFQNQEQVNTFGKKERAGLAIENYPIERTTTQFDLVFTFREDEALSLEIQYNTDIYEKAFVEKMGLHIAQIFQQVLVDSATVIESISLVSADEKQMLLEAFNQTEMPYDRSATITALIEAQANKTPNKLAVHTEEKQLSYQALDIASNQFANYLITKYQIEKGDLVLVQLDRSADLIIVLLGILKTGAAYVPVDPKHPAKRIQTIQSDTNAKVMVDAEVMMAFEQEEGLDSSKPSRAFDSETLAYVIYTSGSTGKPKGVMINHRSLANLCWWHLKEYEVTEASRGTLFAGVAFDASVWEIYPYLVAGATLYPIAREELRLQATALVEFLQENKITHAYLPSKVCQEVLKMTKASIPTTLLTGGEVFAYVPETNIRVYNNYGPTENTVVTTNYDCAASQEAKVPIGKPIANTQVYVLSEGLQLQPVGVIGELCISGASLSQGYWNRSDLTAEKFIEHPFNQGKRLYKTGDLVRWLPDGNIEFIGRKDGQVKIRGHRIELDEISYNVHAYDEAISQAVVVVRGNDLVAYYVSNETIDKQALRAYLKEQLPVYMLPTYYVAVETIPLTVNGKLDANRLPAVTADDSLKREFVAAVSPTEKAVVAIWEKLLKVEGVSTTDDFFELRGHSLLLTKLINEYLRVFKVALDLKQIYSNTILAHHVQLIDQSVNAVEDIQRLSEQTSYDVSPSQMRFWLLYKTQEKTREFNIYSAYLLPDNLEVEKFKTAFNQLLDRHEGLRTVFLDQEGIPKQRILEAQTVDLPVYTSKAEAEEDVFQVEFDLEVFPIFRAGLLQRDTNYYLYFNVHHILSDGWSMNVLVKDLLALYQAELENRKPDLPNLEITYKDYAAWQKQDQTSAQQSTQESYWEKQLAGDRPYLQLPLDYSNKLSNSTTASGYYTLFLDEKLKTKIDALAGEYKVSVFAFFMATLNILLNRLTSEEDLIVGIPVANRNHYQLKDLVGCFLNTLMIRNQLDKNESALSFIQQVNERIMEGLANQNYPFESLLEKLEVKRNQHRFPLSPVFLNMLDFEAEASDKITNFEALEGTIDAAPKFDVECYIKSFQNAYSIHCVFDPELFKPETIQYWMDAYRSIIEQVATNQSCLTKDLEIFNDFLVEDNTPVPTNEFTFFEAEEVAQSMASRFEKQVAKYPSRIAVKDDDRALSYQELNTRANQLGAEILECIGETNTRVALLLDHDASAVLGMLATLKSGNCYVPIDPSSPMKRIEYILKDSACQLILCSEVTFDLAKEVIRYFPEMKLLMVDFAADVEEKGNLDLAIDPMQEAYVLYTSGSTGVPKGVVQIQRNVLHYIRVYTNNIHIAKEDNLSVFSTYTFDASVKDIYGAILNGATVSMYRIAKHGLDELLPWLRSNKVTIIHMVPTIYRHFLKSLPEDEQIDRVRIIDLGGEACYHSDFELFKKYFQRGAILVNDYGPTESTIVAQKFLNHDATTSRSNVALGKSVIETEIFLLDEENNRKGIYEEGELVFQSDYLSLGYLNREELTQKAFTTNPLTGKGRVYRSGDIGRLLPNGEFEFIQRKDFQVKLNGLRIELSEIENQLEAIEAIEEAIVLLKTVRENKYLTAYVRTNVALEKASIKSSLSKYLPKYMIPDAYIFLDTFPLTRTGKIDRKKLPTPETADFNTVTYIAPSSKTEEDLVALWGKVLNSGDHQIGVQDNFFELGGNSLQAVILINQVNKAFDTSLSIENLYNTFDIKTIAGLLDFSKNQFSNVIGQDHDEIIL